EVRDTNGCLVSAQLPLPVIDNLAALSAAFRGKLEKQAAEPRAKGKVDRIILIQIVLTLCSGRFITLRSLAELVNRKPDTLRNQYLSKQYPWPARDVLMAAFTPPTDTS